MYNWHSASDNRHKWCLKSAGVPKTQHLLTLLTLNFALLADWVSVSFNKGTKTMNHPKSAPLMRCKNPCTLAPPPLPGQKAMFGLNMPHPGSRKAVGRVRETEQELCENTSCPIPFEDTPNCSVDCKQLVRVPKENAEGVIFQCILKCGASVLKSPRIIGTCRRAI